MTHGEWGDGAAAGSGGADAGGAAEEPEDDLGVQALGEALRAISWDAPSGRDGGCRGAGVSGAPRGGAEGGGFDAGAGVVRVGVPLSARDREAARRHGEVRAAQSAE